MASSEYITIARYAELSGISRQAVYKKIKSTVYQPWLITENGKTLINKKALTLETCQPKVNCQPNSSQRELTVDILLKQIEQKDKQIEKLHELLEREQKHSIYLQSRLELAEHPAPADSTQDAEEEHPAPAESSPKDDEGKSWWQRFFRL